MCFRVRTHIIIVIVIIIIVTTIIIMVIIITIIMIIIINIIISYQWSVISEIIIITGLDGRAIAPTHVHTSLTGMAHR